MVTIALLLHIPSFMQSVKCQFGMVTEYQLCHPVIDAVTLYPIAVNFTFK